MAQNNLKVKLLIISRWPYGFNEDQWCYLGWDMEHHILVRPIPFIGLDASNFFWTTHQTFQVGEQHLFNLITDVPNGTIPLPHRNDDIHVIHEGKLAEAEVGWPLIPNILSEIAKSTIKDSLGITCKHTLKKSFSGTDYVEEGVDCQSCGVYQCTKADNQKVFVIIELSRPVKGLNEFDLRRCFVIEVGSVAVS